MNKVFLQLKFSLKTSWFNLMTSAEKEKIWILAAFLEVEFSWELLISVRGSLAAKEKLMVSATCLFSLMLPTGRQRWNTWSFKQTNVLVSQGTKIYVLWLKVALRVVKAYLATYQHASGEMAKQLLGYFWRPSTGFTTQKLLICPTFKGLALIMSLRIAYGYNRGLRNELVVAVVTT